MIDIYRYIVSINVKWTRVSLPTQQKFKYMSDGSEYRIAIILSKILPNIDKYYWIIIIKSKH